MEIQFENRGQGHLFGSLGFDKRSYEFHVSPDWIEGPLTVARVTITPPEYLAPGLVVTATLAARTNGGQMDIPVKYRVGARLVLIDEAPSALSQMGASLKGFFSRKK